MNLHKEFCGMVAFIRHTRKVSSESLSQDLRQHKKTLQWTYEVDC